MASATVKNVPLLDDDSVPFGEEDELKPGGGKDIPHPYVTFFHLFFRGASIVMYMLCGWFSRGESQGRVNAQESRIFWLALILCPILWAIFFIVALFGLKFRWLLLVMIALALNGANLYGYVKCNYGASKALNSAASDFVRTQIFRSAVDMMTKPNAQPTTAKPTNVV